MVISIFNIHRHPDFWNDPDVLNPERFGAEEMSKRPKHCFMPFGWGNRNCIGDNYAMLIIFNAITRIVKNYQFSILPQSGLQLRNAPLMCPRTVFIERIN